MPHDIDPDNKLTPEADEVLQGIIRETGVLRDADLGDNPPAPVFEAE